MKSKDFINAIEKKGWEWDRTKGSHHHFKHPDYSYIISVPHPKELKKGILHTLRKQAGLK